MCDDQTERTTTVASAPTSRDYTRRRHLVPLELDGTHGVDGAHVGNLDSWIRGRMRAILRKRHRLKGWVRTRDHKLWPNA